MKTMTTKTKNLLLSTATLVLCGGIACGVSVWQASAEAVTSDNFYSEGASVKITSSVDDAQVRFNATMTEGVYNSYYTDGKANAGVETGILVVPYDMFVNMEKTAGEDLSLDLSLVKDGSPVQKVTTTSLWNDHAKTSGLKESYAVLPANAIPEESHNRLLYFVGYITDGTNEYYTSARKISMSQVAMNAQANSELSAYHETLKATYMHNHTITYKDAYERSVEIQYGESVVANTAYSENASLNGGLYWDQAYTDPVLSTDYVTGDMNVYVKKQNTTELLSFDYASDIEEVGNLANKEWLDEYEGEIGVMKGWYTNGTRWTPQFSLTPVQDIATESIYTDYTHVYVRMYIVNSATVDSLWTYVRCNADTTNRPTAVYNQWTDYLFPIEDLQEYSSTNWMKFVGDATATYGTTGEFYVADIGITNQATVNVIGATAVGKSLSFTATDSNSASVDLTNADIAVVAPDGTRTKLTENAYTPTVAGSYTVSVKTNGYYGIITFNVVEDATELISYNSEADVTKTTVSGTGTTKTWLSSFEGENGVLFVSHTAGTKWIQQFTFAPAQSIAETSSIYEDYDYVVLKMYIVKDDARQINSSWKYVFMNSSGTKYRTSTAVEYNTWIEYKFDISLLKDYATNSTIKFGGEEDGFVSGNQYWGEFYVAGVYLSN